MKTCTVSGCENQVTAKQLCRKHYYRLRNTGKLETKRDTTTWKSSEGVCEFPGCKNKRKSSGLCNTHYKQKLKYGVPGSTLLSNKGTCSVDGCERKAHTKGMCSKHYQQFNAHGKILEENEPKSCSVEGCEGKHFGRGFCNKHYARWRKTGDPLKILRPVRVRECAACGQVKKIHGDNLCHPCFRKSRSFEISNYRHTRRAKMKVGSEKFTKQQVLDKTNGHCGICGELIDLALKHPDMNSFSIDHTIPISKGGLHTIDNVQPAHLLCNCLKQAK